MKNKRLFNLVLILVFVTGLAGTPSSAEAQDYQPSFNVRANNDQVEAYNWPLGGTLVLSIDRPSTAPDPDYTTSKAVTDSGNANQTYTSIQLTQFDLQAGDEVFITDGALARETVVDLLSFVDVNLDTDTVTGITQANQALNIWTCRNSPCVSRNLVADENGNWSVNFSVPGDQDWEQELADVRAGSWIDSSVCDGDGDCTMYGWSVPNPSFSARLNDNEVHGYQWPLGASVTLTIDDPANGLGVDYTETKLVGTADWDPNQTFVRFRLSDQSFVLRSGMLAVMTDGNFEKSYQVANLSVTSVDMDADMVTGTADPGSQVDIGHIYCDQNGCIGFRRVYADGSGNWLADFAHPGEDPDEQDIVDLRPGIGNEARQCNSEGECTTFSWHVSDPRLDASYEFDWISITDFTIGGNVTYTIYDTPGGNILFGPVTGPVDPKGNGWVDWQLHRTDLIPGMMIEALDIASGITKQLVIPRLTFERLDDVMDVAYGQAEPGAVVSIHINGFNSPGINTEVTAGSDGRWYADLRLLGFDVQDYWWANINLCDAENDCLTAEAPKISGSIRNDWFSIDNYSKNSDITMTIFDAPNGSLIFGPHVLHTNRNGQAWLGLSDHAFDLIPGQYVVVTDSAGWSKELLIRPVSFDDLNADGDFAQGTALPGQRLSLHVTGLFSNWHDNPVADGNGNWYTNFGSMGYDILGNMWGNIWAQDNNMDFTQDFTTPPPTISASSVEDWINGYNFSPNGPVRLQIYTAQQGDLLLDQEFTADGGTNLWVDYWSHGLDLLPGMYIVATDLLTGQVSELVLLYLTFDFVDYDLDIATGQATAGARVIVQAGNYFENYEIATLADANGDWLADFGARDIDLTPEMWINARVYDETGNSSHAEGPRPPQISASLTYNWLNGNNWESNATLNIEVYESQGGALLRPLLTTATDRFGNFNTNLWEGGIDLQAGNYIVVTNPASGRSRELVMADLTIDVVDFELERVSGMAPANARLTVGFGGPDQYLEFDLFANDDGTWLADFAAHDFDLTHEMSGSLRFFDEDGDATQVDYNPPSIGAWSEDERVEGWGWPLGATIQISIDDPDTLSIPDANGNALVTVAPWDPGQTWFEFQIGGYDLKVGDEITADDGMTQKFMQVAELSLSLADAQTNQLAGMTNANAEVHVWSDDGSERIDTAAASGEWIVDFSYAQSGNPPIDLVYGSTGNAWVQDADRDQTLIWWQIPFPQCQPGDTVSGTVLEQGSNNPIPFADLQFEDFETGEVRFVTTAGEDGAFSCQLPDGDYRIMASAGNYAAEYYDNADAANATRLQIVPGAVFENIDFTLSLSFSIEHYTFNLANLILQDPAIRQAIALGTNRQRIVNLAFLPGGQYGSVLNSIVPPGHWAAANSSDLTLYPYDPEQAKTLLAAAGWIDRDADGFRENQAGDELALTFKTTSQIQRRAAGELFQQDMEQLGIRLTVQNIPAGEYFADNGTLVRRDFDIAEFAWGSSYEDETVLESYVTGHVQNYSGYSNSDFDTAIAMAALLSNPEEKLPYLVAAQNLLSEDLPILPMFTRFNVGTVATPIGSPVEVALPGGSTIHFMSVTEPGWSTALPLPVGPIDLPADFQLLGQVLEIGTSAEFDLAQVCIPYDDAGMTSTQEGSIKLHHLENNVWVDVTDEGYPDIDNNQVCGTVSGLSPFALLYPAETVDITPPTITWVGSIADGDQFFFGNIPPAPICTATDEGSGVADGCTITGYETTVGTHTLIATARDVAGNITEERRSYTVHAWNLLGFHQPVDMGTVYNLVKGGSTVPLKFEIFAGNTERTSVGDVTSLSYAPISCALGTPTDSIETTVTGNTSLRYDTGSGQFIYNWKTPALPGKCYRVTLFTNDGSTLMAYFKFK